MTKVNDILSKAEKLFFRFGVKSISMDDISREMGISKKTLYLYVENKDDLVFKTMQFHLQEEMQQITEITKNAQNSLEEFVLMLKHLNEQMAGVNPAALFDIRKFYPKTWQLFLEYKEDFVAKYIMQNLKSGQEQGYYREDLNREIIAQLYIKSIDVLLEMSGGHHTRFDFPQIYREYLIYHLRGIASEKGHEYINSKLKF